MSLFDLCRCGHTLADHERLAWSHTWTCFGDPLPGSKPCDCDGCQEEGAPPQCACRRFRPVEETTRPERPAEATT